MKLLRIFSISLSSLLLLTNSLSGQSYQIEAAKPIAPQLDEALTAANANQIQTIKFGPGTFEIDRSLKIEKRFGENGIRISGAGNGITRLHFNAVDAGFDIQLDTDIKESSHNPGLTISDLSLHAIGECGTAIKLTRGDQTKSGGISAKVIDNVSITGVSDYKNGSWETGIHNHELTFLTIRNFTFRADQGKGTAIHLSGENDPVDHHLNAIRILGSDTGIKVSGSTEGVYIHQTTMIACNTGIDWSTTSYEPLLLLSDSHINAKRYCIKANHLLQPIIQSNLFYQMSPDHEWTGLSIETKKPTPYDLMQISNNTFHGDPNHKKPNTGLHIEASTSAVLQGNIFSAVDTAISLGKEAANLSPSGNVFRNKVHTKVQKP